MDAWEDELDPAVQRLITAIGPQRAANVVALRSATALQIAATALGQIASGDDFPVSQQTMQHASAALHAMHRVLRPEEYADEGSQR